MIFLVILSRTIHFPTKSAGLCSHHSFQYFFGTKFSSILNKGSFDAELFQLIWSDRPQKGEESRVRGRVEEGGGGGVRVCGGRCVYIYGCGLWTRVDM